MRTRRAGPVVARPLNCGVMRRGSLGVAGMFRRNGLAVAAAALVACDSGSDDVTSIDEAQRAPTQAEQIAEAMRDSRLIGEEMKTVQGPSVLVTVERGGESLF